MKYQLIRQLRNALQRPDFKEAYERALSTLPEDVVVFYFRRFALHSAIHAKGFLTDYEMKSIPEALVTAIRGAASNLQQWNTFLKDKNLLDLHHPATTTIAGWVIAAYTLALRPESPDRPVYQLAEETARYAARAMSRNAKVSDLTSDGWSQAVLNDLVEELVRALINEDQKRAQPTRRLRVVKLQDRYVRPARIEIEYIVGAEFMVDCANPAKLLIIEPLEGPKLGTAIYVHDAADNLVDGLVPLGTIPDDSKTFLVLIEQPATPLS